VRLSSCARSVGAHGLETLRQQQLTDLGLFIQAELERRIVMKKLYVLVTLVATLMGGTLLLERTVRVAAAAPAGIKNVVLVHGAFADGSGWEAVAKILEKDGYTVSVAQPPETSYAEDQKYTKAAIDAMGGPGRPGRP
jgi:hypothetical protein